MRLMVVFEKGEALRHIGHLDLMRAMQRALRRSGLPVQYSKGFNPHIRLSFAAPLSVGVIGLRELMELPVEADVGEAAFLQTLNAALPDCLRVRECHSVSDDFPTLMSLVAGSRYLIRFEKSKEGEKVAAAFGGFMSLAAYVAARRTKSGENPCDIKPFVKAASLEDCGNGYEILLETVCTEAGALKPSLWMDCLCEFAGADALERTIYRNAILSRDNQGQLIPMEALANG